MHGVLAWQGSYQRAKSHTQARSGVRRDAERTSLPNTKSICSPALGQSTTSTTFSYRAHLESMERADACVLTADMHRARLPSCTIQRCRSFKLITTNQDMRSSPRGVCQTLSRWENSAGTRGRAHDCRQFRSLSMHILAPTVPRFSKAVSQLQSTRMSRAVIQRQIHVHTRDRTEKRGGRWALEATS